MSTFTVDPDVSVKFNVSHTEVTVWMEPLRGSTADATWRKHLIDQVSPVAIAMLGEGQVVMKVNGTKLRYRLMDETGWRPVD